MIGFFTTKKIFFIVTGLWFSTWLRRNNNPSITILIYFLIENSGLHIWKYNVPIKMLKLWDSYLIFYTWHLVMLVYY